MLKKEKWMKRAKLSKKQSFQNKHGWTSGAPSMGP
jgi:hypothetical protein